MRKAGRRAMAFATGRFLHLRLSFFHVPVRFWTTMLAVLTMFNHRTMARGPQSQTTTVEYRGKHTQTAVYMESELQKHLMDTSGYRKTAIPRMYLDSALNVTVGMSLFHILKTDEKMQTISTLISVRTHWTDYRLAWNVSQHGGLSEISVPATEIWTPDLVIMNSASEMFHQGPKTNVIIHHSGNVLWTFPMVTSTYCTLDVRFFPFDTQECSIVFISWTHSGRKLDLMLEDAFNYYDQQNKEWEVFMIHKERQVTMYPCCDDPFPDLRFTIHMVRRSTFYMLTLIVPCGVIFLSSFIPFLLHVESGDKVKLQVMILLALVIFLMVLHDTMPPTTGDSLPYVAISFLVALVMVALGLIMAGVVTNLSYRRQNGRPPPYALYALLFCTCCQNDKRRPWWRRWCCCCRRKLGKMPMTAGTAQMNPHSVPSMCMRRTRDPSEETLLHGDTMSNTPAGTLASSSADGRAANKSRRSTGNTVQGQLSGCAVGNTSTASTTLAPTTTTTTSLGAPATPRRNPGSRREQLSNGLFPLAYYGFTLGPGMMRPEHHRSLSPSKKTRQELKPEDWFRISDRVNSIMLALYLALTVAIMVWMSVFIEKAMRRGSESPQLHGHPDPD